MPNVSGLSQLVSSCWAQPKHKWLDPRFTSVTISNIRCVCFDFCATPKTDTPKWQSVLLPKLTNSTSPRAMLTPWTTVFPKERQMMVKMRSKVSENLFAEFRFKRVGAPMRWHFLLCQDVEFVANAGLVWRRPSRKATISLKPFTSYDSKELLLCVIHRSRNRSILTTCRYILDQYRVEGAPNVVKNFETWHAQGPKPKL